MVLEEEDDGVLNALAVGTAAIDDTIMIALVRFIVYYYCLLERSG